MHPLAFHRSLLRFALALVSVYAWVFFFQFFYLVSGSIDAAFAQTAFLFALTAVTTTLLTPYAARTLRNGTRRAMYIAMLYLFEALVVAGSLFTGIWVGEAMQIAFIVFAISLGVYRAFYWTPYAVERAGTSAPRVPIFHELIIALAPALAGLCIASDPSAVMWLFFLSAILGVLSLVPLLSVRDVPESYMWSYRETFHELMVPEHRAFVLRAFWEGCIGTVLLLFWPLAIFVLFTWSYATLGVVLSATYVAALLLRKPVRTLVRRMSSRDGKLLTYAITISPWLFRLVVAGPFGVALVDSLFYTTTPMRFGVDPFTLEQSVDAGSFVDEYTALKEIGLHIGRLAAALFGGFAALTLSVPVALVVVFLLAALASGILAARAR